MREPYSHVTWRWMAGAVVGLAIMLSNELPANAVTCGDTIGPRGTVLLQADIIGNCVNGITPVLRVVGPVTLDLNGHTVSCGPANPPPKLGEPNQMIGILVEGGRADIRNGAIAECSQGIRLHESGYSHTLEHLLLRDNWYGIRARGPANKLARNAFLRNVQGLAVDNVDNLIIENTATGNHVGFMLSDDAGSNRLIGNAAARNTSFGFTIRWSDNTLIGNIATDNTEGGFLIEKNNNRLLGNSAARNGGHGFVVSGSSHVISGSTVRRNGGDGLLIKPPGGDHIVEGNLIKKNGGNGITVGRFSNGATIVSNRVLGHAAPRFDLVDANPGCLGAFGPYMWKYNEFATRSQECIE